MKEVIFICINGYNLPYARVRCYNFAKILNTLGMKTEVLSFQDDLSSHRNGIQMLELTDREKLKLNSKALLRLLKKKDAIFYIQKVHYHTAVPYLLYRLHRNGFILDYDDWDIDRSPLFKNRHLNKMIFKNHGCEKITQNIAKEARQCIVSSNFLYKHISGFNPLTCLIPTGVDTSLFKPDGKSEDERVTFIWTGQVWGKVIYDNIIFLLECFFEVSKEFEDIEFKIVGEGEYFPKLRKYVKERLNFLDIKFIDWVEPDKMPEVLSSTDIGLLPLIPDKENELWMRGKSPTKLFEYMASGLVPIATKYGEPEYIIENGKDGFLAEGKKDFVEKMQLCIKNKEIRKKIGREARKKVMQNYSLESLGGKLFNLISKIN